MFFKKKKKGIQVNDKVWLNKIAKFNHKTGKAVCQIRDGNSWDAKITEIYESGGLRMAKIDFGGVVRDACLAYVPEAEVGDDQTALGIDG